MSYMIDGEGGFGLLVSKRQSGYAEVGKVMLDDAKKIDYISEGSVEFDRMYTD